MSGFPDAGRERFLTSFGAVVRIEHRGHGPLSESGGVEERLRVSGAGRARSLLVRYEEPEAVEAPLREERGTRLDDATRHVFSVAAAVEAVEDDPDVFDGSGEPLELSMAAADVLGILRRPRLDDRPLRRYIARRLYHHWARFGADRPARPDRVDYLVTGAGPKDFARNAGLLEREGYLEVRRAAEGESLDIRPTALLIREVERRGGPRADVTSGEDYEDRLSLYAPLVDVREPLALGHGRYVRATTAAELAAVFRTVAPVVETLLRDVLQAHGSRRSYRGMAPILRDLKKRNVGDRRLRGLANHVHGFTGELERRERGDDHPTEGELRIACENSFELVPRIAALADRGG